MSEPLYRVVCSQVAFRVSGKGTELGWVPCTKTMQDTGAQLNRGAEKRAFRVTDLISSPKISTRCLISLLSLRNSSHARQGRKEVQKYVTAQNRMSQSNVWLYYLVSTSKHCHGHFYLICDVYILRLPSLSISFVTYVRRQL